MSASLPQGCIDPGLREQVEAAARGDGQTIYDFEESAVRRALDQRALQAEFFARGQAARAHFPQTGASHSTEDVMQELRQMAVERRTQLQQLRAAQQGRRPAKPSDGASSKRGAVRRDTRTHDAHVELT
jgi:hypothetical protein